MRVVDADTGNIIQTITRRGKTYMVLRNAKTGRFIKFLREIEIRAIASVEYTEAVARKKNPIYIDSKVATLITPEIATKFDEVVDKVENAVLGVIKAYFNVYLKTLAKVRGIEVGSIKTVDTYYLNREAYYSIVWKHHKTAPLREAKGIMKMKK